MKILMISEFFPTGKDLKFSGGVEARTYFVARQLSKENKVKVICIREPHTKVSESINGIQIKRVGPLVPYNAGSGKDINPLSMLSFIRAAIREGIKSDADIVDGGNFIAHLIAKQISIRKKIPVIFWYPDVYLGNWVKTSGIISGFSGFILEKLNLLRGADHFIAISKSTKDKLVKQSIKSDKITVIPCGIDKSEFTPGHTIGKNPRILTIARLVKYKRIKDLVLAAALVFKKNHKVSLMIIGRGPEEENLKELIDNLKIQKRVIFKRDLPRKNLIEQIKSSTIFSLPSETEGFGISIIEAAAAQIPYVVSDIEVFREVTKNGRGGFLFETGNISDLANKIQKLLSDKKLYQKKSKEAKNLSRLYDWQKISSQTEQVYKSVISTMNY